MPLSRKRKKHGKKVSNGEVKRSRIINERIERAGDQLSGVTLQDLINVVAYQDSQKPKMEQEQE